MHKKTRHWSHLELIVHSCLVWLSQNIFDTSTMEAVNWERGQYEEQKGCNENDLRAPGPLAESFGSMYQAMLVPSHTPYCEW